MTHLQGHVHFKFLEEYFIEHQICNDMISYFVDCEIIGLLDKIYNMHILLVDFRFHLHISLFEVFL